MNGKKAKSIRREVSIICDLLINEEERRYVRPTPKEKGSTINGRKVNDRKLQPVQLFPGSVRLKYKELKRKGKAYYDNVDAYVELKREKRNETISTSAE